MVDRPEALTRLDAFRTTTTIAHEAIFDLHRALVAAGQDDDRTRELLAESARIAVRDLPDLTAPARGMQERWDEQSLLDPARAGDTLRELEAELRRVEPSVRRLLDRQRQIARTLQSLLED
jgi:hypothetical protein